MKLRIKLVMALVGSTLLLCCNNEEERETRATPFPVYVEYSFWAEEDKGFVTGLFQFRMDGEDNTPSRLKPPARVELDGERIDPDSAGISGSFYEINKPLDEFKGAHEIVLTTAQNERIIEEFNFSPFSLQSLNDTVMTRDDFVLTFEGLKDGERVRIVMTDTSFSSNGINTIETIKNGQADLRPGLAGNIVNGPVVLQVFREEERMIRGTATVGGKISITYSLKKEFELVD